jgi:hypothetical protein
MSLSHEELLTIHKGAIYATNLYFRRTTVDESRWKLYYEKQIEKYPVVIQKAIHKMLIAPESDATKNTIDEKSSKKSARAIKKAEKRQNAM